MNNEQEYKVANIVVSSRFLGDEEPYSGVHAVKLDLKKLKMLLNDWNAKYDEFGFPAVFLKLKEPKATILVFSTGRLVITGLERVDDVIVTIKRLWSRLSSHVQGTNTPDFTYKIVNMTISIDLRARLDLDKVLLYLSDCIYEPERFPALRHYMRDHGSVVALVFPNGKISVVGIKSKSVVPIIINKLKKKLKDFERNDDKVE